MNFLVTYSIKKDIKNYLSTLWRFRYLKYGREDIQRKLLAPFPRDFKNALVKASTEKEATLVIKRYLDSLPLKSKASLKKTVRSLQEALSSKGEDIISLLEALYNKPFPFKKITIYITTLPICPYNFNEKWFMVSIQGSKDKQLETVKHELNHFMFYHYYSHLRKKLSYEKFESLKEALTVFTNPKGTGKPSVKKLEEYLKTLSGRPMDEVVNKALKSKYL